MDHMEFSIALPQCMEWTSVGGEWSDMKQRLNAHVQHSSDAHHQPTVPGVPTMLRAFLISIASDQVQELFNWFGLSYDEAVKFNTVLQRLEDICLPRFLIIYNRYKFFTTRQSFNDKFDDFLRDLLNWSDFCEFGDLKDILVKDCIITGLCDHSVRQNLLKTEELDFAKTLNICRMGEKEQHMKNSQVNTDQAVLCDVCVGTEAGVPSNDHWPPKQLRDASVNVTELELLEELRSGAGQSALVTSGPRQSAILTSGPGQSAVVTSGPRQSAILTSGPGQSAVVTSGVGQSAIVTSPVSCGPVAVEGENGDGASQGQAQPVPTPVRETINCQVITSSHSESEESELSQPTPVRRSKRLQKSRKTERARAVSSESKHWRGQQKSEGTQDEKKPIVSMKMVRTATANHKRHPGKENLICVTCDEKFEDKKSLKLHTWQIHGETKLKRCNLRCRICKLVCKDFLTLRKHRLSHKGEKKFKCDICCASFGNPSHLTVHMRLHTGERPFTCDTCGVSFPEASKLKAHMRKHTGEKPYHCHICQRTFAWTAAYTRHLRTHTGERPYTCEFCGGSFADFTSLQRHRRIHTNEKPYQCDRCPAHFADPSGLKLHKRTHTGERPYACETCGAAFARSNHLKDHLKLHTGEKPFECETCGAKFTESSKLTSHRRKHTGEKPYMCKICGASFAWTAAYTRHMRTHTLEKPYVCDFCGTHYADHSTLTRHRRTHTGERPYPCKVCATKFADNSSLHRHMRIHTGEKSYTCEVCGSSFAVKSYLIRHMRTHTGEKPYSCITCGSKFTDSSKLKRHSKIHEKDHVKKVKQEKLEEPAENYEQLRPLQHFVEGELTLTEGQVDLAVQPDLPVTDSQSLTLAQDLQQPPHPLLVTTNFLPLTSVLPFSSSIIS